MSKTPRDALVIGYVRTPFGRYGGALAHLRAYHYLGCDRPVGSHLLYLVQDAAGRDLAVAITSDPNQPARSDGHFGALMRLLDGPILNAA